MISSASAGSASAEGAGLPVVPVVPVVLPLGKYKNEYGFIAAAERLTALAPAPAVSVNPSEIDQDKVTEPEAGYRRVGCAGVRGWCGAGGEGVRAEVDAERGVRAVRRAELTGVCVAAAGQSAPPPA